MTFVSRLSNTFSPNHYDLSITLQREARLFSGVVTIDGTIIAPTNDLRLHAKGLIVETASFDGKTAQFSLEANDELVITHPDITEGKHTIVVSYSGAITDDMNGVYPCYYEVDGQKKEVIATQFESHYARQAFPCVDEPEAKATFDVTVTTETNSAVLGNMPIKLQREENGQLVTTFETTPRMSTYLVAWVAGDLQKKAAKTKSGVEVSIWSTKAHDPSNLDFALDIATRTIDFFNDYFGVPYPLPKSDHVALPDFSAGAMENWGLITYREIALLVDPKTTSLSVEHYVATVIAHELSHQWFGNLVTMKWWNDLWLNESFANMMEYVAVDALEPSWDIWLDYATTEIISALRRDSLDGVQAIQTEVRHPDEINTIFDPSIVYAKGGRLLRMLQAYIGQKSLRAGLKRYFETHQYQNTEADDLWQALGKSSGKDVASFMHAWMTQPGYPVIHASKNGDTITVRQEQFFVGPHAQSERRWPVPLHGSTKSVPEILQGQELTFTFTETEPLLLNKDATAHFITHYDDTLRADIVQNLHSLSSVDRLHFLNEQLLLAKAGIQSYAALLPLLAAYKDETNESVWSIMSLALNELKRFVDPGTEPERKLKKLTAGIVSEQYERLGWDQKDTESQNDTLLRSYIVGLALYAELPDALNEAEKRYKATPLEELDAELRGSIMAHAVRSEITPDVVDILLSAYPVTINSELRDDIAGALTATKNSATIERLIALLKDTTFIRPQDFIHWFVWLLRNRYSRDAMWQWARDNWQWLEKTFSGDSHYDMLPRYIASTLVSRAQLEEFKTFFAEHENKIALARNISIGYTELEGTVNLLEADSPIVRDALMQLP